MSRVYGAGAGRTLGSPVVGGWVRPQPVAAAGDRCAGWCACRSVRTGQRPDRFGRVELDQVLQHPLKPVPIGSVRARPATAQPTETASLNSPLAVEGPCARARIRGEAAKICGRTNCTGANLEQEDVSRARSPTSTATQLHVPHRAGSAPARSAGGSRLPARMPRGRRNAPNR